MHFGRTSNKWLILTCLLSMVILSCSEEKSTYITFSAPEAGQKINAGKEFGSKLDIKNIEGVDSIVYFIDTLKVGLKQDASEAIISTEGVAMGNHVLMAKIHRGAEMEEITTNIVVVAAKAPKEYGYKVINTFPHDTDSYVQGLEYHKGFIYESAGQLQRSNLRKVDLTTGKVLKRVNLEDQYFAEGITIVDNKIVQITYQQNVGFVYDLNSLNKVSEFSYPSNREGWGLAYDGQKIFNSSGSSSIYMLDKNTHQTTGYIQVFDHNGPVDSLNELEYIDGKIYANIYKLDGPYANKIVIIDPLTGGVEGVINLTGLHPIPSKAYDSDYILNGIAYDKVGKRLFVTGKMWPSMFEIELVEKN